eukprot:m.70995 g.70995  ORF g.70995 m.70995 type:complete len:506 (-) comp16068_c0_seq7:273-1790(-)
MLRLPRRKGAECFFSQAMAHVFAKMQTLHEAVYNQKRKRYSKQWTTVGPALTLKTRTHVALPPSMMPKEESARRSRKKNRTKKGTASGGDGSSTWSDAVYKHDVSQGKPQPSIGDGRSGNAEGDTIKDNATPEISEEKRPLDQHVNGVCDEENTQSFMVNDDADAVETPGSHLQGVDTIGQHLKTTKATENPSAVLGSENGADDRESQSSVPPLLAPTLVAARECGYCHENGQQRELQRCARCRLVWYCGTSCQRNHYLFHRYACLQQTELASPPPAADETRVESIAPPFADDSDPGTPPDTPPASPGITRKHLRHWDTEEIPWGCGNRTPLYTWRQNPAALVIKVLLPHARHPGDTRAQQLSTNEGTTTERCNTTTDAQSVDPAQKRCGTHERTERKAPVYDAQSPPAETNDSVAVDLTPTRLTVRLGPEDTTPLLDHEFLHRVYVGDAGPDASGSMWSVEGDILTLFVSKFRVTAQLGHGDIPDTWYVLLQELVERRGPVPRY